MKVNPNPKKHTHVSIKCNFLRYEISTKLYRVYFHKISIKSKIRYCLNEIVWTKINETSYRTQKYSPLNRSNGLQQSTNIAKENH